MRKKCICNLEDTVKFKLIGEGGKTMVMVLFFSSIGIAFYKIFLAMPKVQEKSEIEQTTYEHSKAAV